MTLASNPYVKAELDNLQLQFGTKGMVVSFDGLGWSFMDYLPGMISSS